MRRSFATLLMFSFGAHACAQPKPPITLQFAEAAMTRWPDGYIGGKSSTVIWGFEPGIVLAGFEAVWEATRDRRYLIYIKNTVDQWVQQDGSIKTYDANAYSLNNILIGRELLLLQQETHENKYDVAAKEIRKQLIMQPRNISGGMWHIKGTPNLMLLDDQFMVAPFYTNYAKIFREPADLDDVSKQLLLLDAHARDPRTGLMYHGWDESKEATWANKKTGTSPNLWARGMGWYLMALVDTLQYLPESDAHHKSLLGVLHRTAVAVERAQDHNSSLWYQIVDKPALPGNYIESSSVLMFIYAFGKGTRLGYLPKHYRIDAERAWKSVKKRFVQRDLQGHVVLSGTVTHISMGATPRDDGSDSYYLKAPMASDDPKGIGAFLLAGSEMELRHEQ